MERKDAMNETASRSPDLMSADDTGLLVVDVQEKLMPAVEDGHHAVWNVRRLIDGAKALGVPVAATVQYPKGLGSLLPEIAERVPSPSEKMTFSCRGTEAVESLSKIESVHRIVVVGVEAHVCVQQTVLDLLADGWRVYVPADAIGSRDLLDETYALQRMEASGATLTTTEAVLFEWCGSADHPAFKDIRKLVMEEPPEVGFAE